MHSFFHHSQRVVAIALRGRSLAFIAVAAGAAATSLAVAVAVGPLEDMTTWPIFGFLASAQSQGYKGLREPLLIQVGFKTVATAAEQGSTRSAEAWNADDCAAGTRPDFAH